MTTRLPPRSIQTHAGSTAPHSYLFNVQDPFLLNLILDDRKRIKKSRIDGVSFLLSHLETNEPRRVSLRTAAEQTNAFFSIFVADLSLSLTPPQLFLSIVPLPSPPPRRLLLFFLLLRLWFPTRFSFRAWGRVNESSCCRSCDQNKARPRTGDMWSV